MLGDHIDGFIEHLKASRKASELTLISYRTDLTQFLNYLALNLQVESALVGTAEINHRNVKNYLARMQENGFSRATMARKHATIRSFVRYLCYADVLPGNPIASIKLPEDAVKLGQGDIHSVELLLGAPNSAKAAGMRDRTIMELLYFCRLRIVEVSGLNLADLDLKKKIIWIGRGGDRERCVGAGKRLRANIKKYIENARPLLAKSNGQSEEALFLSKNGSRLTARAIRSIINKYIEQQALELEMNEQKIRLAVAGQFAKSGADIKAVQEIFSLGRTAAGHLYSQIEQEEASSIYSQAFNRG